MLDKLPPKTVKSCGGKEKIMWPNYLRRYSGTPLYDTAEKRTPQRILGHYSLSPGTVFKGHHTNNEHFLLSHCPDKGSTEGFLKSMKFFQKEEVRLT